MEQTTEICTRGRDFIRKVLNGTITFAALREWICDNKVKTSVVLASILAFGGGESPEAKWGHVQRAVLGYWKDLRKRNENATGIPPAAKL